MLISDGSIIEILISSPLSFVHSTVYKFKQIEDHRYHVISICVDPLALLVPPLQIQLTSDSLFPVLSLNTMLDLSASLAIQLSLHSCYYRLHIRLNKARFVCRLFPSLNSSSVFPKFLTDEKTLLVFLKKLSDSVTIIVVDHHDEFGKFGYQRSPQHTLRVLIV